MPTETGLATEAVGSVGVHARDEFGNPIYLGTFPTLDEALAVAAGQSYVDIVVNDPATPGGLFVLPPMEPLFFSAPSGWMARLDLGPGLNYISLGGDADFYVVGNDADNFVFGSVGDDRIVGLAGADFLEGFDGADLLLGGDDADILLGMKGNDVANGENGNDEVLGDDGKDTLSGGAGADTVDGGKGNDRLDGGGGNDSLLGGAGGDVLKGGAGADTLDGGAGDDRMIGGAGRDSMTGGDGVDRFVFAPGDSAAGGNRDRIADFVSGIDKVDFSAFALTLDFIGSARFGGTAGEVRFAGGILSLDADGDRAADLQVDLGAAAFTGGDLI